VLRIAVIITTYNRPDALAAVLEGYVVQSDPEFEVIVADDGSGAETRAVVDELAARAPFPLRHVWQKDEGFRAAAIRNKAIAATDADYVIFTDGDCVPGRTFVAQHRRLAEHTRALPKVVERGRLAALGRPGVLRVAPVAADVAAL